MDSTDNVINALTLNGGEGVEVYSTAPNGLTVDGTLKTGGDVTITSEKALTFNGKFETEKNINLTAGKTVTNDATDISSTGGITVTKPDEQKEDTTPIYALTSSKSSTLKASKQITLNAGDVKLSGKLETAARETSNLETEPGIKVTTGKGLDMQNAANNFEALTVNSSGEQIEGSVLATSNSEGFIARIDNVVTGDLTLTNKKDDGTILLQGYGLENRMLNVTGNITLNMGGTFYGGRPILASKDINITSRNGEIFIATILTNQEDLKATKNVTLKTAGNIDIEGKITAGNNITVNSAGLDVFGAGNMTAGDDITLTVSKGDIKVRNSETSTGSVTSVEGNVKMTVKTGDIDIGGELLASDGKIDLKTTEEGNIQIGENTSDADTVVSNGNITMSTTKGNIGISGSVTANKGNVKMDIDKGDIDITGKLRAEGSTGKIDVEIGEGNIQIGNDTTKKNGETVVFANRNINITTDNGIINISGNTESNKGTITVKANPTAENTSANVAEFYSYDLAPVLFSANVAENNSAEVTPKKSGDISITSNHDTYTAGQKSLTVEETGAINPGRNLYLNVQNGDIEFKKISAENANINSSSGNVTADTIKADDTIHIELSGGDLYLNLAQSKAVAILTGDSSKSSVKTIRADSVNVNDAVKVGRILPYRSAPSPSINTSTSSSSGGSNFGYSNGYSNSYSNFASNPSSFATLGTTFTTGGLTYRQNATSTSVPDYSFSEFEPYNDMSYRQTRNYFEVRFVPTWLEKEFLTIDFDYSFDNFGIRNATEDELTID